MGSKLLEDLYKLHNEDGYGYLDLFMRMKERGIVRGPESDLNQYKTLPDLARFIDNIDINRVMQRTKGEMSKAIHDNADNIELLLDNENWKILIPKSYEASCYWGSGTEWCTATRETDEHYNRYTSQGPLYINIRKKDGEKFQFHFPSHQLMDKYDCEIDEPVLQTIGADEDVCKLYSQILGPIKVMNLMYEDLGRGDGPWLISKNINGKERYNIIGKDKMPLCDVWYDNIGTFHNNYYGMSGQAAVVLNGKMNWITSEGNLVCPNIWFERVYDFKNGYEFAPVIKDSQYNFVNTNGELISSDMWFDDFKNWRMNGVDVCKDGFWLYMTKEGKIIIEDDEGDKVYLRDFEKYKEKTKQQVINCLRIFFNGKQVDYRNLKANQSVPTSNTYQIANMFGIEVDSQLWHDLIREATNQYQAYKDMLKLGK